MKLKSVSEQVIVITGATSGIGLTTARAAAARGAKLVLIGRNEHALRALADELNSDGDPAVIYSACDVTDETALQRAAEAAQAAFGGFDTWVNNAGVSIYGKIEETPTEDMRRLFDTNFWGVVYGSRVAVEHLKRRGGAIINIGSVLSDRAISLQGVYSASKHAVKGFTDALRMEVESDKLPISVTLVKPSAINTPYPEHAKNYLEKEATLPPPVFAPDLVAEAILHCAGTPTRDFTVGEGKILASLGEYAPRLTDKVMQWGMAARQMKNEPRRADRPESLYESKSDLRERGNYDGMVFETSLYQRAKLNPLLTGMLAIGGAIALAALYDSRKRRRNENAAEFERFNQPELLPNEQPRSLEVGHS